VYQRCYTQHYVGTFGISACPEIYLLDRTDPGVVHSRHPGNFSVTQVIKHAIDVKVANLMKIINPLINSARPQINNMLQQGMELNLTAIAPLKKLNVTGLVGEAFFDYASFGLKFDL
jgi:hypothetical protein